MEVNKKTVSDICDLIVKEATIIYENETIGTLFHKMIEDQRTRHVYVVDKKDVIVGSVRLNDLVDLILPYLQNLDNNMFNKFISDFSSKPVSSIMLKDFLHIKNDTNLSDMISQMLAHRINELPIVDDNNKIIGEVNFLEFIKFLSDGKQLQCAKSKNKE